MARMSNYALILRRLLLENRSLTYQFHRLKKPASATSIASRLHKPHIYLAFLGFSFGSKPSSEEQPVVVSASIKSNILLDQAQMENADQLFDDNKFQETVDFLKTLDQSSAEVQWRLGRALFKCSGMDVNSSKKNELIREAFKNIHEALQKDDNNFAIHKWYAILLDANSNLDGIKTRVQELENVKKHMVRAIELNPEDPTSRYILGEFAFGLADLPWYQRKIVATIFATPPSATYEEALEHFLKAEDLKADFYSMNKLMIGKCYIALKDNEKAKEYLTKASSIPVLNEDDRKCKEEATKLLGKVK